MKRIAFNDMLGKGWDSALQESFAWQRYAEEDPQFWWVPVVYEKWGHAHDWDKHKRNDKGQYVKFPAGVKKKSDMSVSLLRLATFFDTTQADHAIELIRIADEIDQQE